MRLEWGTSNCYVLQAMRFDLGLMGKLVAVRGRDFARNLARSRLGTDLLPDRSRLERAGQFTFGCGDRLRNRQRFAEPHRNLARARLSDSRHDWRLVGELSGLSVRPFRWRQS